MTAQVGPPEEKSALFYKVTLVRRVGRYGSVTIASELLFNSPT